MTSSGSPYDILLFIFLAIYLFYVFKFRKVLKEIFDEAKESIDGDNFAIFVSRIAKYIGFQTMNIIIHGFFLALILLLTLGSVLSI